MNRRFARVVGVASIAVIACFLTRSDAPSVAGPAVEKRLAWKTSKVVGSPEPPHRYRVVRTFTKLQFKNPLHITNAPGTDRLFVLEQAGRILSFPGRPDVEKADLVIDVSKDLTNWKPGDKVQGFDALYGMTFHPKFAENRYCYVCYVLKGKGAELPDGSRVSRFTITKTDPPKIDPSSEKVVLTFLAGGHNGGCLAFGPDDYLYISTGDAANPNPPDSLDTGQDCSDLLSSVLRIDVDREEAGKAYAIPKDNPFVGLADVRPEVWAFGFRNPWKMSFDRKTGDLWLGDVGWELWEMVYRIKKGGNYGWAIKEGPQSIKPDGKIGPTPILPPTVALPHTEAASITGGFVYRGTRHKDLVGAYICGDWMSRKYWAVRADGDKVTTTEIAQGPFKIISFSEDNAGELYLLDYSEMGGIYVFEPDPEANKPRPPFPTRLSATGLFNDLPKHEPAAGVYGYSINAEPWADHATATRLIGLPGQGTATMYHRDEPVPDTAWFKARVFFPKDGVLVRSFAMEMERGNSSSRRWLETQLLHFDGREWRGYTYRWNDQQTDATLVPAAGEDMELTVKDAKAPGGIRKQTWHFPSRTECRQCHNPWAGEALSFTEGQLRRTGKLSGPDELTRLVDLGLVQWGKSKPGEDKTTKPLVNPHDAGEDLHVRARSYLHVNCAHCHQFGAGGSVNFDIRSETGLDDTKAMDAKPVQGTFGIPECRILAAGDPYRSVLYYRMAKQGRGRMPHIGSELVDEAGVRLIGEWIRQLPPQTDERTLLKACCQPDPKWKPNERKAAVEKLLGTPSGALMLQEAWDTNVLPEFVRPQVLAAATAKDAPVRDLFEKYIPDAQKVKRLGTVVRVESLLAMKGDVARGKDVFFKTTGLQCATCHKAQGQGGQIGPDLSDVGKRLSKRQILESILDPSKDIDPKFAAYIVELDDGRQLSGLIVAKDDKELTVRDPQGKDTRVSLDKVVAQVPSKKSLMPDQLLRDLTAEQAADLLAYLESLR